MASASSGTPHVCVVCWHRTHAAPSPGFPVEEVVLTMHAVPPPFPHPYPATEMTCHTVLFTLPPPGTEGTSFCPLATLVLHRCSLPSQGSCPSVVSSLSYVSGPFLHPINMFILKKHLDPGSPLAAIQSLSSPVFPSSWREPSLLPDLLLAA